MSHYIIATVHVVLLLFVLIAVGQYEYEDCDRLGVLMYEDLGCQAEFQEDSKCPVNFNCTDWDLTSDTCLFQSKRYPIGSSLNNSLTISSCNIECECRRIPRLLSSSSKAVIERGLFKCSEWFGKPPTKDCYRTYELGICCSISEKCPKSEEVSKCVVDGKTFLEGQKFFSEKSCLECICTKDFDGSLGEKNCRRQSCGVQLRVAVYLSENCAPVYFDLSHRNEKLCCPEDFICPSAKDEIIQMSPYNSSNSDLKCIYGATLLQLGEGFNTKADKFGKVRDVKCECMVPPLVTCREYSLVVNIL